MAKTRNDARRQALAPGLPRCLDGLKKLERPLCLSRRSKPSRRRILNTRFVRSRVGRIKPDNNRPGAMDRALMLGFYGNPETRRELWRLHREGRKRKVDKVGPGSGRQADNEPLPPSLEYMILGDLFAAVPAVVPETRRRTAEEASESPAPDSETDRLRRMVLHLRARLAKWPELDDEAQLGTKQELFALATLLDDRSVLEDACDQVAELREEYAALLTAADDALAGRVNTVSAPTPDQRPRAAPEVVPAGRDDDRRRPDATDRMRETWRKSLRALAAEASSAADAPPDTAVLESLKQAVGALEGLPERHLKSLEASAATERTRLAAEKILALIEEDSSCAAIDPAELHQLRGRWLGLPALAPVDASAERARLQEVRDSLLEDLRRADDRYRRVEEQLDLLRSNRPSKGLAIRGWEDDQYALHDEARRFLRKRRAAEDALLLALVPSFQRDESLPSSEPSPLQVDLPTDKPAEDRVMWPVDVDGPVGADGPPDADQRADAHGLAKKPALRKDGVPSDARESSAERDEGDDGEISEVSPKDGPTPGPEPPAVDPQLRPTEDAPQAADETDVSETKADPTAESSSQRPPTADETGVSETKVDPTAEGSSQRQPARSPSTPESVADSTAEPDAAATDEVATAEAPEVSNAEVFEQRLEARKALAQALADEPPRLAYAAQLCGLLEQLGINAGQPMAALLEAALYASRLDRPDGELSAAFQGAVEGSLEAAPRNHQNADSLDTEALIRFAAAMPTVLLAPYSGAAAMLQDLAHEGLDRLYRFAREVAARSWDVQKAQIDAATLLGVARDQATQASALSGLRQELDTWCKAPAKAPLSYTPANKVWRTLAETGELAQLVQTIRSPEGHRRTRELLGKLEDEGELRKIVDRLSEEVLSHRQSVDTRIFRQLRRRLDTPLELARRYLSMETLPASDAGHRQQVIDALVHAVRQDGPRLRARLERLAADPEEDPLLAAAASVAGRSLRRAEDLVDPQVPRVGGDEPEPSQLLASDLFAFPELRIDESGRIDGDAATALQTMLRSEPVRLEDALATHLEHAEIATAERILEWLDVEADAGEEVESWRLQIDVAKRESLAYLKDDLEGVRDHLDLALAQLQIDEHRHTDLQAQLLLVEQAVESGSAVRFNQEEERLRRMEAQLEAAAKASRQQARTVARRKLPKADDPRRLRVEQYIADDDLVTANELLYRSDDDDRAMRRSEPTDQSTSPLDAYLEVGRKQLGELRADWRQLRDSAKHGTRLGPLRFDRLDTSERTSASVLLGAWSAVKRCSQRDRPGIESATGGLLTGIGFLDAEVEIEQIGAGFASARMTAAALRNRNDCPIPYFGSEADGRYRLLIFFDPVTAEQMLQRLQQSAGRGATIAICLEPLGEHTYRRLAQLSREQSLSLVTLDESLLAFLAAQPGSRLAGFFACALPFTHNQPFAPRAGLVPPEMFFGREDEIRKLLDLRGSCLVYGGRQLGKTALLRHVEREYMNADQGQFAIWIDLKGEGIGDEHTSDVWAAVWRKLRAIDAIDEATPKPTRRTVRDFMEALHGRFNQASGRTLLLLFDEADNFLRRDAMNSNRETFAESTRLKSLMDRDQSIKVVFAGLHNVLRTTSQANHPLAHLGRPISIGPFIKPEDRRHGEDLLRRPLEACGYRFDPPRLAPSVLARTNYYPGLLQTYGVAIVNRLSRVPDRTDSPIRKIDRRLLESLQRDRGLREEIRQRFEWTLQLDPRYEAIAYTIAFYCLDDPELLRGGIEDHRILDRVRQWWPPGFADGDIEPFQALLEEMVELGVLRHTVPSTGGARCYSLRNPNVLALLGDSTDVDNKLDSFEKKPAQTELGPFQIRRRHGDHGPFYRPLTLWQERRISGQMDTRRRLARGRNAVILVCGLEASGIRNVASFLQYGKESGETVILRWTQNLYGFEGHLKRRLDSRKHETTVFVVPADRWKATWVDAAIERLGRLTSKDRFARIVFTVDADRLLSERLAIERWLEQGAVDLVALRPWDQDFAALFLDEHPDVGAKLSAEQEKELAGLASGWPIVLDLILRRLRPSGARPSELIDAGGFESMLAENAETLHSAFGLALPEIATILRLLQQLGAAARDDLLNPENRDLLDRELDDDELRHALWAAEKLHLIQATGHGELQVDRVVRQIL